MISTVCNYRWSLSAYCLWMLFLSLSVDSRAFGQGESADSDSGIDLRRMEVYVAQFSRPRNTFSTEGMEVGATLIPDAFAYVVARKYLSFRREGSSHVEAVDAVAAEVKRSKKKLVDHASLRLVLRGAGGIHSFHGKLPGKTIQLAGRKKNGKAFGRVPVKLSGKPKNLRLAKVRVKGLHERERGKGAFTNPPRKPRPSKSETVLLLEKKRAELQLSFQAKYLQKAEVFRLRLGGGLKRYRGPFERNLIDLGNRRTWDPIETIEMRVDLPPEGTEIPASLRDLLEQVSRKI